MKRAAGFLYKIAFAMATVLITMVSHAQDKQPSETKSLLESKDYVFKVETVNPSSGRSRILTSDNYTLNISGDSVISDLPYFGRAYSAPIGQSGGYHLTSTQFDYSISQDKKKRWQIAIKPRDVSDGEQFTLTVFENGRADLTVTSNSRQPITYRGYITGR